MTEPQWLKLRGGSLRQGPVGQSCYVMLDEQPQYRLTPTPVRGKFGCDIIQTVSGKMLPCDRVSENAETALQTGLEELAKSLGWLPE